LVKQAIRFGRLSLENYNSRKIKKNCDEEPLTKFELARKAHDAYRALKSHYEGKTVTDLGAVLANVIRITYNGRQNTIDEHITEYEKQWGFMRSILNSGEFPKHLNTFGRHLKGISESDIAKAEFLLLTLPPYYNTLVKNLHTKEKYNYGDIVRSLKLYVPGRQKNKKGGKITKSEPGTSDNPIILKIGTRGKGNKTCRYCKEEKGWRGIGHTEDECFTKKRDLEKDDKKEAKHIDIERDLDDEFIHTIRVHKREIFSIETDEWFEYDTGASAHTTNQYHQLKNIRTTNIPVYGYDGSTTKCTTIGNLEFNHNRRKITIVNTLYHDSFSSLISGQLFKEYEITATENEAIIKVDEKTIYKADRINGKLWIKPDEVIAKTVQKGGLQEIHERYRHLKEILSGF
jgi:hypothetical protein